jgi:hypothetical protein
MFKRDGCGFMKYRVFVSFIMGELLVFLVLLVSGRTAVESRGTEVREQRAIVKQLMLTDVAIWTEARYTRNPSQADYFSAFQDFPSSLEHFPAGSIIAPGGIKALTEIKVNRNSAGMAKK